MKSKKKMNLLAKQSASGWVFLTPATILIAVMAFWPMIQAFIMSLQTGSSANMKWSDPIFNNYTRMFSDKLFLTSVKKYVSVSADPGADHVGTRNPSGAASEQ